MRLLTAGSLVRVQQGEPNANIVRKVGINCYEVTPVPFPNTEVKLINVENTWLVTTWEDRYLPTQKSPKLFSFGDFFGLTL